jgi:hypothetical protein
MSAPVALYKYEQFSAQSIENLKKQVIYFGSPLRFNDPYDCALFPSINEPSDEEVERIRDHYLSHTDLDDKVRGQFQNASTAGLRVMLLRIGQGVIDSEIQRFLSQRGVSCFAERPDNLLMWSHYAGHHKGFCLEFKTDSEPFQKIRKVHYSTQMPAFDLVPMLCDQDYDQVLDLFCTKSIDWKYEREWRAIHKEAGTAYTYPAEALTGVYFEPEASFTSIEIIALVLAGQNEQVKLWKGTRSKSNFSVNFEAVTYTSHLEAKRRGLR